MDNKKRIKELVELLRKASEAYYNEDDEIMSNYEYDSLFDELVSLEKETGYVLKNSPTQNVGFEIVTKLEKVTHEFPALSLDKLKDRIALADWLGDKEGCLGWKMDGITVVATYEDGKLIRAVTRGNGYIGEDITHNAKRFVGLPNEIDYTGHLIVRGEATMTNSEFERINSEIPDIEAKYKNTRNLASATARLLDSSVAATRKISFTAFTFVYANPEVIDKPITVSKQYEWLKQMGFSVVGHTVVTKETISDVISEYESKLPLNDFPSDGLVVSYNDVKYGESLGLTGHHPRSGMAFKWADETQSTILRKIEWSASRTGLLNPVAIFDPVELEGTTVSRASTHNVSITKKLQLGIGSKIEVYKANMIIPQIAKNVEPCGDAVIPDVCPICGGKTKIHVNDGIETLYCENENCQAKNVGKFTHFASRDCMNISGLSKETLEKFVELGIVKEFSDIYRLESHKDEIVSLDGFGEKSFTKMVSAINESRNVKFSSLIASLGIAGVGKDLAKQISKCLKKDSMGKFINKTSDGTGFNYIDGVGDIINDNIINWFSDDDNNKKFLRLLFEVKVSDDYDDSQNTDETLSGMTFVITGSLNHYENRDALKDEIERNGGKVSGSVSAKTSYLINNDVTSTSGKNKKAKELGVQIISEEEYMKLLV